MEFNKRPEYKEEYTKLNFMCVGACGDLNRTLNELYSRL